MSSTERTPLGIDHSTLEHNPYPALNSTGGREDIRATSQHCANVCIVTLEINGPWRNGGIGTAYTALAEVLAGAGQQVTVLYLQGSTVDRKSIPFWTQHYQKQGIRLVPIPETTVPLGGSRSLQLSYQAYHWLRRQEEEGNRFDVIHFHEWLGFGYYTLVARHQGLAFANTTLCVGTHSPSLWIQEANQEFLNDLDLLECDALERRCVELADRVWSPSEYMLDWMRQRDWSVGDRAFVLPYLVPGTCGSAREESGADHQPVQEFVFFGRLQVRKGLVLFCDALDRLAQHPLPHDFRVSFLGKAGKVYDQDAGRYLRRRAQRWPFGMRVHSNYDHQEGLCYLQRAGRVAVMPSLVDNSPLTVLECLSAGIPFLASNTGGIPEVVAEADQERVLIPPHADLLAHRLHEVLHDGLDPARSTVDTGETRQAWESWHQTQFLANLVHTPTPSIGAQDPLVTICLVHRNRPTFLQQALRSLEHLDYPNWELVLVDDGSTAPQPLKLLTELEPLFLVRGWPLIRQENRYLGAARNEAVRRARGEYLLFMDDDNCAKPHELTTLVRVAQRMGADIVTSFMDMFEGNHTPREGDVPACRWLFAGLDSLVGIARNCFGDANALVRRSAFDSLGGFTEDHGVTHEDWEFFARAVQRGYRLEVVPEALYWYRLVPESMIRTTSPHLNYTRSLRPYLEDVPTPYHDLLRLAQGQALRNEELKQLVEQLGEGKPLRYRVADLLHHCFRKIPLLYPLLRSLLLMMGRWRWR